MSNMLLSFLPFRAARVVTHTHRLNSQTKSFLERSVSTTCKIEQASDASHFVQVEGPHILGFLGVVGFPSLHSIKQPQTAQNLPFGQTLVEHCGRRRCWSKSGIQISFD